jgi:gliding motility-associated-like protein
MRFNKNNIFILLVLLLALASCREKEWTDNMPAQTITIKFDHDTTITIYDNQTYILNASTGDSSSIYSWGSNSIRLVNEPGTYSINIQTGSTNVTYYAYFNSGEPLLFYPNAFSPNGGELNGFWSPIGTNINTQDYLLKIYDSQQHLLFKTDQFNARWDGTAGGDPCPCGTYYYVVKYKSLQGVKHKDSGMFQLIR